MPWTQLGATVLELEDAGGRIHTRILGRFVTVLRHQGQLYCIDSACHHASGPLGEGAVTDIEGIACIKCPWHNFIFALDNGERVQQELKVPEGLPQGTFTPQSQMQYPLQGWPPECLGPAKRTGIRAQRTHGVRVAGEQGEIEVDVTDSYSDKYLSDGPSTDAKRGKMCMTIVDNEAKMGAANANDNGALPLASAAAIMLSMPLSRMRGSGRNAEQKAKAPVQTAEPINEDEFEEDEEGPPSDARALTPPPAGKSSES
jgi:nitrite reductase/ring-hydroxylating ferredoxin subunit